MKFHKKTRRGLALQNSQKINVEYSKFNSNLYHEQQPFPHIVVDDLFDTEFINSLEQNYPGKKDVTWWKYDNHFEKKLAFNHIDSLHPNFKKYFDLVNSREFVKKIEEMTGIPNLIADPGLNAAGLHRIESGGKLDVHADYNYHKITGWRRRLNLITYLNKDWQEEYSGHTQFWNADMSECIKSYLPVFNRTILFETDDHTYHGHPEPLKCPVTMARKSLAVYYYTFCEEVQDTEYRSTDYKRLPTEKTNPEIEKLREQRRKGRLKDLTT